MRYFITGGAGFIGSHIVDRLMAQNHDVVVYDLLINGKKEFIRQHLRKANFKFIYGDILDFELLKKSMEGSGFIFHLAANADIKKGLEDTKRDLMQNTVGTYNVIEAMKLNGIKKIAFTSSAAVYGEPDKYPTPEDYPLIATSFYGASKSAGESLIESFCDAFGFQTWIFRFVSVAGERYTHGCIYDFIKKLNSNPEELEILGDGTQRKSYVYVNDCLDAMFYVIEHAHKKVNIYNIGTDYFLAVKEIAGIVTDELGLKNVRYHYTGGIRGWQGDSPVIFLSVEKINKLGWKAKISIEEAVRSAARYLIDNNHLMYGNKNGS